MTFENVEIGDIPGAHPVVIFHDFWRGAADGNGGVAPWARFDAADHPRILPWVLLLKREDGPAPDELTLRYAVCGTGCTELFGFSYQGKLFGESLPPDAVARRREEFDRVVSGSGPLFSRAHLPIPDRQAVQVYRGVFPFSSDGNGVDRIMVVIAKAGLELSRPNGG